MHDEAGVLFEGKKNALNSEMCWENKYQGSILIHFFIWVDDVSSR